MSELFRSSKIPILLLICVTPLGSVCAADPAPFKVPAESTIPDAPRAIKLGKALITDTRKSYPFTTEGSLSLN